MRSPEVWLLLQWALNQEPLEEQNLMMQLVQQQQTTTCATPTLSHGNSYIFYKVANLYEFAQPHSYNLVKCI